MNDDFANRMTPFWLFFLLVLASCESETHEHPDVVQIRDFKGGWGALCYDLNSVIVVDRKQAHVKSRGVVFPRDGTAGASFADGSKIPFEQDIAYLVDGNGVTKFRVIEDFTLRYGAYLDEEGDIIVQMADMLDKTEAVRIPDG